KHDRSGDAGLVCLAPRCRADAPAIARLESGKSELRSGCDQVVALLAREFEEVARYPHAYDVQPLILAAGVAAAVAVEAGERRIRAGLQLAPEDVLAFELHRTIIPSAPDYKRNLARCV